MQHRHHMKQVCLYIENGINFELSFLELKKTIYVITRLSLSLIYINLCSSFYSFIHSLTLFYFNITIVKVTY